jgi:Transposase DDE domain
MPAHTPSAKQLFQAFDRSLEHLRSTLLALDVETIARRSGFLRRCPRKISMSDLVLALLAVGAESVLSLERVAHWVSLVAGTSYSKQAFHKRLGPTIEPFLAELAATLFGSFLAPLRTGGGLAPFQRVLLQDSTTLPLPERLAKAFPGAGNAHHKTQATLKIQCVADLLRGAVVQLSLSGFRRNDQAASADILALARPGDLILRDLGYFSLEVLAQLNAAGAFFLTRWRRDLILRDPRSGRELNLARQLRQQGGFDGLVWVGKQQLPLRLVALALPEEVANGRRHQAKINRDGRLKPSKTDLYVMGWNIFLTNIPPALWSADVLAKVYRLRWRVELIFKTWKSHLGLSQLNCRSAELVRLSAMCKLLFCALMIGGCSSLAALCTGQRQISLLRWTRTLAECSLIIVARLLGISADACLQHHLDQRLFYEVRPDRKNFYDQIPRANHHGLG